MPYSYARWLFTAGIVCCALACGDDTVSDTGVEDAGPDLGADFGRFCAEDSECDDGVSCTIDRCVSQRCRNEDDFVMCDDGVFCNGREVCDRRRNACVPGNVESCNDRDVCTIDRCDEEANVCRFLPRDFDGDGEADFNCEGGTDCDDRDPTRGTRIAETCEDGIDNDCDEQVDEADCGAPQFDSCDEPLDISAGGLFELDSRGARPDHGATCAPPGRADVVMTFELDEPADVTIRVQGESIAFAALRSTCGDQNTERECREGFPAEVRQRALSAGRYFVIVADIGGPIIAEAIFAPPTVAPTNESCMSEIIDVSEGGRFEASFVDVGDELELSCGGAGGPELVYTFTLKEAADVFAGATARDGTSLAVEVRENCIGSALRCERGQPVDLRARSLEAGSYFLIVESPTGAEPDFLLDVSYGSPSMPPEGDDCTMPLPVDFTEATPGTLRDKQDDLRSSCEFFYRDAVHSFVLEEPSDVVITAEAVGSAISASLRSNCGLPATEVRCTGGDPANLHARDLEAGTYFIVLESPGAVDYMLSVQRLAPSGAQLVTGNDTCETAIDVPPTSGIYSGTTNGLQNDYGTQLCGSGANSPDVAFRMELDREARVRATTEGSDFDTVLHLHSGECRDRMERQCNDDTGEGATSRLEVTLQPGVHFFVVDGWGASSSGEYIFEYRVE